MNIPGKNNSSRVMLLSLIEFSLLKRPWENNRILNKIVLSKWKRNFLSVVYLLSAFELYHLSKSQWLCSITLADLIEMLHLQLTRLGIWHRLCCYRWSKFFSGKNHGKIVAFFTKEFCQSILCHHHYRLRLPTWPECNIRWIFPAKKFIIGQVAAFNRIFVPEKTMGK